MPVSSGHAVFVNGIPSAGKSSVAAEIESHASSFRVLTGDRLVRQALGGPNNSLQVRQDQLPSAVKRIFATTLDVIDEALKSSNAVVDGAWTKDQVVDARNRFGSSSLFVILRIDEAERRRRESSRSDRSLTFGWNPAWHEMPGPDELYDLALDSAIMDARTCADVILAEGVQRWGGPL